METPTRSATEETVAEHIPWQQLTLPASPPRGRVLYLLAAAVAMVVVGVVVGRAMGASSSGLPSAVTILQTVVSEPASATTFPPVSNPLAAPTSTSPLREADLMASPPVGEDQSAAARAEWFIGDYFLVDGGDDRAERIGLAAGWSTPPTDIVGPLPDTVISYVEWAKAAIIRQVDDRVYEVTVVFRRYVATDGATFTRLPTEAASVEVRIAPAGASTVVGWPKWVDVPGGVSDTEPPPLPSGAVVDGAGVEWPVER